MDFIISILVLLATSIIAGAIFERFGLPGVVGQMLGGLFLGPAIFNAVQPTVSLSAISDIALFFIVLLLGLEANSKGFIANIDKSVVISVSTFILPAIVMIVVSFLLFHLPFVSSIVVSIAIAVPSISIVSVLLRHYSFLDTEDGNKILSSVIISDILAFIAIAAINDSFNPYLIIPLIIIIGAFIVVILFVARVLRAYSHIVSRFFDNLRRNGEETAIFAIIILIGLIISSFLQSIGITFVLGAFFSGMLIEELIVGKKVFGILIRTFTRINKSFFIPLFFGIAGLAVQLPDSNYILLIAALVFLSAMLSSFAIRYIGKNSFKHLKPESTMSILGGRGAIGVVIATISLNSGFISISLYSVIIFGTILLSLIFPSLIKPELKDGVKPRIRAKYSKKRG